MASLSEIISTIRELSYDRFPVPCFYLKTSTGKTVTNDDASFKIKNSTPAVVVDISYSTYDTMEKLLLKLIESDYPVSYTGYFLSSDSPTQLLKNTDKSLSTDVVFNRKYFLSDEMIKDLIVYYYSLVLRITLTKDDLATKVTELTALSVRHITLFVAILLVDKRQLADVASLSYDGQFTDGTGISIGGDAGIGSGNINVTVGSVFNLTEDESTLANYFSEDFNRVGSDNVLGNKTAFLFKLFLHLRNSLESEFNDFYFRKNNVISGKIILEKDLNYRAYFDSYPFTLSPYDRDIR